MWATPYKTLTTPGQRASIESRITRLPPSSPRAWGRMTVNEMLCHLAAAFELTAAAQKAGTQAKGNPLLRLAALRIPIPWPHNVQTHPSVEAGSSPLVVPAEFEQDRRRLLIALGSFCSARHLDGVPHPFFGAMSEWDWHRWGYLHADHHLRQFRC